MTFEHQALPELSRVVALQLKHTRHAARWSAVHSHDFGLRALVQSLLTPLPAQIGANGSGVGLGLGLGLGSGGGAQYLPLTALDLEGCELGHAAGTVLAELVAGSRTLRFLQLRNNRLGESLIRVVDDAPVVVEKCPGFAALCAAAAQVRRACVCASQRCEGIDRLPPKQVREYAILVTHFFYSHK